jgi:hypothetical protein
MTMAALDDIIRKLEAAKGDVQEQAVITADFALSVQPEHEREALRSALNAAAVLTWFDVPLLAHMLQCDEARTREIFQVLARLPFVESFPGGDGNRRNIHEATRLGWRRRLARDAPEDWRTLSSRAAAWFDGCREPAARIQRVYHLLSADPDSGARCLEDLDREWTGSGRPEDRQALALAVGELETTGLVDGAARVEVLLCTAEVRSSRGETAQLGDQAREAESLARRIQHWPGLGRACCLLGDVHQARGDLAGAEAAFGEYVRLTIFRRLVQQDPSNAGWQRDLAVAHSVWLGDVLQARGDLAGAEAAFGEYLTISRRLAQQDPSNAGGNAIWRWRIASWALCFRHAAIWPVRRRPLESV